MGSEMADQKGSLRIQLSAEEIESARKYFGSARESLEKLSQLVVGKLGKDHPTVAGFKVGSQAVEKGHIPSDLDRGLPDVTVFVDENGDCVGMYVDPPGICTDEC
jgi:hypothetical protein